MSPRVAPEHSAARRLQILKAAARRFSRHGFHQTSMQEICREARLSPGAVYNYFEGKSDIVRALAKIGKAQTDALLSRSAPAADLGEIFKLVFQVFSDNASAPGFQLDVRLWGEALHDRDLREIFNSSRENLLNILTSSAQTTFGGGDVNVAAFARLATALIAGLELEKAMNPEADFNSLIPVLDALISNKNK